MTLYKESNKSRLCLIHNPLSDLSEITFGLTETKRGLCPKTQQKNIAQQISNRIMPKKQNDRQMEKMKLIESCGMPLDIEHVSPPREKFTKAEKNYYYSGVVGVYYSGCNYNCGCCNGCNVIMWLI